MTNTEYADPAPSHGKHELAPEDEGKWFDVVRMYGDITNFVMPVPRRQDPPRHLAPDPDPTDREN